MKALFPLLAITLLIACGTHRDEYQYDTNPAEVVDNPGDLKRGDAETNREAAAKAVFVSKPTEKIHPAANEFPGHKVPVKNLFAIKAAQASLGEVTLSQMAAQKTKNDRIKDFAMMMIKDHSEANNELKAIAAEKGIDIPAECLQCEADYKRLHNLPTTQFDEKYVLQMVKDHQAAVQLFTEESQNETDPDLKKWAADKLPTLQHHLEMAKNLAEQEHVSVKSDMPKKHKKEKKMDHKTEKKAG